MSKRNATANRIMDAARSEFADYGFAGARIDRIARNARCNKQAIYAYIGDKLALWKAVYTSLVQRTVDAVPLDARKLADYAEQLFDHYRAHPEILRLSFWYALEGMGNDVAREVLGNAAAEKTRLIKEAQSKGHITGEFQPDLLLAMILRISMANENPPEGIRPDADVMATRKAIRKAVERLVKP